MNYVIVKSISDDGEFIICSRKYSCQQLRDILFKTEDSYNELELDDFETYLFETLPSDITVVRDDKVDCYYFG